MIRNGARQRFLLAARREHRLELIAQLRREWQAFPESVRAILEQMLQEDADLSTMQQTTRALEALQRHLTRTAVEMPEERPPH